MNPSRNGGGGSTPSAGRLVPACLVVAESVFDGVDALRVQTFDLLNVGVGFEVAGFGAGFHYCFGLGWGHVELVLQLLGSGLVDLDAFAVITHEETDQGIDLFGL